MLIGLFLSSINAARKTDMAHRLGPQKVAYKRSRTARNRTSDNTGMSGSYLLYSLLSGTEGY